MDFIPQRGGPGSLLKGRWPLPRSCIVPASDKRTKCQTGLCGTGRGSLSLGHKTHRSLPSLFIDQPCIPADIFPATCQFPYWTKTFIINLSQQIPEAQIGAEKRYCILVQHCARNYVRRKQVLSNRRVPLTLISAPAMKHPGFPDMRTADLAEPSAMNCNIPG